MPALQNRPVTIIGAGIGGLTAAIALAQRGAQVTVLERAPELTDVGAGIQLSPNAMRVLDRLGLHDAVAAVSLRSQAVQLHDQNGAPLLRMDLIRHRPNDDFRLIHRARLINVLAQAAHNAGVIIHLNHNVTTPPDAPLVIGADGLHSRIRPELNGTAAPFFTGQTAWRALIPDDDAAPQAQVFTGPGRHLVSYPLAPGLRNIVAVMERPDWQAEGWSHLDDPVNLRTAFAGFGGPVPGWLDRVDLLHIWGLFRHPVAPVWQDGRMAILGDAAHPTLPFMAQGAVMAIEDAWTLAACLDADTDQTTALARYQTARLPRTTQIVAAANANARNYHLTGPRKTAGHAALRLINKIAPQQMLTRFNWIYDYNPVTQYP
ncbi:FAD-dependent oxidoreductase [Paracoccus sp. (in: a-proteobacteria)]|uniref:FAD-dependent oxidoreductase n=1 Tax=Paracoccus sp. TaxID=267 RepID=UPI0026E06654|nr:FAD-dependent oxidoreductase [Paracoccus sp. (in: a-proteobacteria)]MDO5646701.1 FAD-dependent oxidoreductase [Paracoccus sp. (in: a-proteobacteria)]